MPPANSPASSPRRYAVVGGGVSGLTAAYRLRKLCPDAEVRLIERSGRLGGPLHTHRSEGVILERGADSFATKTPDALELVEELGLGGGLISTNESHRRALVVRRGQLRPVPEGFVLMKATRLGAVLRSPVLSPLGKLRLALEPLVPKRDRDADGNPDESLADFARRRLGSEVFERLVQPLAAGIYTSDGERLSMNATMREFAEAESQHGSLFRAARHAALQQADNAPTSDNAGARYSMFVSFRGGISVLAETLAERIGGDRVSLDTPVAGIERTPAGKWRLLGEDPAGEIGEFDGVVLATPASVTAGLIRGTDSGLADRLGVVEAASSIVVCLLYRRDQIRHALDAFGFVAPVREGLSVVAGSFASVKFPGRVPAEKVLLRAFVGGAVRPELNRSSDTEAVEIARRDLGRLLGISGGPELTDVTRWPVQMPQYEVGHLGRVAEIESLVAGQPGLELAGCCYHGVGIPQCVASGNRAAERLRAEVEA